MRSRPARKSRGIEQVAGRTAAASTAREDVATLLEDVAARERWATESLTWLGGRFALRQAPSSLAAALRLPGDAALLGVQEAVRYWTAAAGGEQTSLLEWVPLLFRPTGRSARGLRRVAARERPSARDAGAGADAGAAGAACGRLCRGGGQDEATLLDAAAVRLPRQAPVLFSGEHVTALLASADDELVALALGLLAGRARRRAALLRAPARRRRLRADQAGEPGAAVQGAAQPRAELGRARPGLRPARLRGRAGRLPAAAAGWQRALSALSSQMPAQPRHLCLSLSWSLELSRGMSVAELVEPRSASARRSPQKDLFHGRQGAIIGAAAAAASRCRRAWWRCWGR